MANVSDYPLISSANKVYKLKQIESSFKELQGEANRITSDEEEIIYLEALENFTKNTMMCEITKIKNKTAMIKRCKNFDCSKVENLPDDILNEIKSYLEPEIAYTKKYVVVNRYIGDIVSEGKITYFWSVPKKLITDLKLNCNLYLNDYVKASEPKNNFVNGIFEFICKSVKDKDNMRVDKLLALQTNYMREYKQVEISYKFLLYISTYLKYRKRLEENKSKKLAILKSLKNNKIVVK